MGRLGSKDISWGILSAPRSGDNSAETDTAAATLSPDICCVAGRCCCETRPPCATGQRAGDGRRKRYWQRTVGWRCRSGRCRCGPPMDSNRTVAISCSLPPANFLAPFTQYPAQYGLPSHTTTLRAYIVTTNSPRAMLSICCSPTPVPPYPRPARPILPLS